MCASKSAPHAVDSPAIYRIAIQGKLDPVWKAWFDGMELNYTDLGLTLLKGQVADQAALHGMLAKIRDLGLVLVSLEREA
jgi:hypothetical protein